MMPRKTAALGAVLIAAACTEVSPVAPADAPHSPSAPPIAIPEGMSLQVLDCVASVRSGSVVCGSARPLGSGPAAAPGERIVGGQDLYVRLASANPAYDSGTELFSFDVTVQNLTQHRVGTEDGSTVDGVKVFFSELTVTAGSGTADVVGDGTGTFTASNQPYFLYNQILSPLEISDDRHWVLSVSSTVDTFTFKVYVAAPMEEVTAPLLDAVWTGATSTVWSTATNWSGGLTPGGNSAVTLPSPPPANAPVLDADANARHLRVASGSTLDLGGFTLTVGGNLDAPGTITSGSVELSGADALLRGNLDDLLVSGGAALQGNASTTGEITVSGALTLDGHVLTILVP